MDKALPSGGRDCGFESHQGRSLVTVLSNYFKIVQAYFCYLKVNANCSTVNLSTANEKLRHNSLSKIRFAISH